MQIIGCTNCNIHHVPLEHVTAVIKLSKSSWCDKCFASKPTDETFWFCSVPCMIAFFEKEENKDELSSWEK